jgi:nicotinamide mononucleotide (NMN) deamidase PncC
VTGVGTQAIAWLFAEPGASRTVLDAQVPYSAAALDEYVGGPAEQHVSSVEALRMAKAALARARKLAAAGKVDRSTRLVGVGCTGAIATDRVRRGEDRVHVAWTDGSRVKTFSLVFDKEARDRRGEEYASSVLVLNALAQACGLGRRAPLDLLPGEAVVESE